MDSRYQQTVALLLDTVPLVFQHDCFVMKGGTAINLFCRDMPRLSVDIDLVFIDPKLPNRDAALLIIEERLEKIAAALKQALKATVQKTTSGSEQVSKLYVSRGNARVKIEVNHVFRGSVYPTIEGHLFPAAEALFEREVSVPMLDIDELYASKLVAALDRQHPRDIFDVMLLYQHGGITPRMRRAFTVYLAGHNRPMHELLPPQAQDMTGAFEKEFIGMTLQDVDIDDLEATRERLFSEFPTTLDEKERAFLWSLHRLEPEWELLGIAGVEQLPAVRWKLLNLNRLKKQNPLKFDQMLRALEGQLGMT